MKPIGIAVIEYNEEGKAVSASFKPTQHFKVDDLKTLLTLKSGTDKDAIRLNAELAMASWFSNVNSLELADRDKWKIQSRIVSCENHKNGMAYKITLEFKLVEVLTDDQKRARIIAIDQEILGLELSDQDFVNAKYINLLGSEKSCLETELKILENSVKN